MEWGVGAYIVSIDFTSHLDHNVGVNVVKTTKGLSRDVKRLQSFRQIHGLNQRQLAVFFGVSHGAISLWESGERELPGIVATLLEALTEIPNKNQVQLVQRILNQRTKKQGRAK